MAGSLTFSLRNNQMTNVKASVVDLRTNANVLDGVPLNTGESAPVTIVEGSDERGSAFWVFASRDGSVKSNKRQEGIRDGDERPLGRRTAARCRKGSATVRPRSWTTSRWPTSRPSGTWSGVIRVTVPGQFTELIP